MTTPSPATAAYEARLELERELESTASEQAGEDFPYVVDLLRRAAAELRKDREQDQVSDKIGAELAQQLAAAKEEIGRLKHALIIAREEAITLGQKYAQKVETECDLRAQLSAREPSAVLDERTLRTMLIGAFFGVDCTSIDKAHAALDTFIAACPINLTPAPEFSSEPNAMTADLAEREANTWTRAAQIIEAQDGMSGWKRRIAALFRDNANRAQTAREPSAVTVTDETLRELLLQSHNWTDHRITCPKQHGKQNCTCGLREFDEKVKAALTTPDHPHRTTEKDAP